VDVKTAIRTGDVELLRALLTENPARANELIRWGNNDCISTHPLHFISDMLIDGTLQPGKELPLVDALLQAGAEFDLDQGETPLIGAASLGAQDVGLRLLEAGARPEIRGLFGETALHWAAMTGSTRLVKALIQKGAPINQKDDKYQATPLGWAEHGKQSEAAALLIDAGATT